MFDMRPFGKRKSESDASVGLGCCSRLSRMGLLRVLQGEESLVTDSPPAYLPLHFTDICPAVRHNCPCLRRAQDELAGIAALEDAVLEWRNAPKKSKGEQSEWFHPLRSLVQAGIPMVCFSYLADMRAHPLESHSGAERYVYLHWPHAL